MEMKRFNDFINENVLNQTFNSAHAYLNAKGLMSENGFWNSNKSIMIESKHRHLLIKDGKLIVKFGKINGDFNIQAGGADHKLTSSEGLPAECKKLDITYNEITNLNGIGKIDSLDAANNKITSLEGLPKTIEGSLDLQANELTTLKRGPELVKGYVDVSENDLTDLQGAPHSETSFYLHGNLLNTLYGLKKIDNSIEMDSGSLHDVPEEEVAFLKSKINSEGYVFDNYIVELIEFVIKEFGTKGIRNLNIPEEEIKNMPDDIKNVYTSAKGLNRFNM